MASIVEILIERLQNLNPIEYFTFTVNALVFIFSKQIARMHGEDDLAKTRLRLRTLHSFNLVVFLAFIISIILLNSSYPDEQISQPSLCLLIAYVIYNIADGLILKRYGEVISVMGSARTVETATSRTLELIVLGIILITSGITLINIWGITGILETTGAIGFLALLIFTTKDYWLNDFLSGILIISGNSAKRGDVISIPDLNVLGIIMEIGGLQTRVRDLAQGHDIEIPNNAMLNHRTDFYKDNPGGPHKEFVEFNIDRLSIGIRCLTFPLVIIVVSIHLPISECGGKVFSNVIYGPSRLNGLSSRGANCVWEIQTSQNNTGTVYVVKFR